MGAHNGKDDGIPERGGKMHVAASSQTDILFYYLDVR